VATVTRDTTLPRGTALSQVPRNSGRLWANYRFGEGRLEGLSIGGGLYGASEQAVTVGGPWRTPGYVTLDAAASYPIGGFTVAVVAKNLANQRYWVPYSFLDGRVAPGAGRTVFATVSARF
jgi:iron complex outermembrane receptor protein